MRIYPAIDIRNGKAVRLKMGNYDDMTVYGDDPVKIALDFKALGAQYIHVVSKPRFLLRIPEFACIPILCRNLLITVKLLIGTSHSKALTTSCITLSLFLERFARRIFLE